MNEVLDICKLLVEAYGVYFFGVFSVMALIFSFAMEKLHQYVLFWAISIGSFRIVCILLQGRFL